jgi:hypothetical protein
MFHYPSLEALLTSGAHKSRCSRERSQWDFDQHQEIVQVSNILQNISTLNNPKKFLKEKSQKLRSRLSFKFSMRKLEFHEAKLLKKVDLYGTWKDENPREALVIKKYHLTNRSDYHQ